MAPGTAQTSDFPKPIASHFEPQCFATYLSHFSCALEPCQQFFAAAMSAYEAPTTRRARAATVSFIVLLGGALVSVFVGRASRRCCLLSVEVGLSEGRRRGRREELALCHRRAQPVSVRAGLTVVSCRAILGLPLPAFCNGFSRLALSHVLLPLFVGQRSKSGREGVMGFGRQNEYYGIWQ